MEATIPGNKISIFDELFFSQDGLEMLKIKAGTPIYSYKLTVPHDPGTAEYIGTFKRIWGHRRPGPEEDTEWMVVGDKRYKLSADWKKEEPKMSKKIEMGNEVQDIITGVKGTVTATASYITGCDQALVNRKVKKDGTYLDGLWFDVARLKVLKKGKINLPGQVKATGGPQQSPDRR